MRAKSFFDRERLKLIVVWRRRTVSVDVAHLIGFHIRITECALDIVSIVDELGLDRVHLVGHDWGAAVAWQLAIKHAERLRTLRCC